MGEGKGVSKGRKSQSFLSTFTSYKKDPPRDPKLIRLPGVSTHIIKKESVSNNGHFSQRPNILLLFKTLCCSESSGLPEFL